MMTLTLHAVERYAQRVKGVPKEDALKNKSQYEQELKELAQKSQFIYTGEVSGNKTAHFYLVDPDIILVVSADIFECIMTVYKADFGFSPAVNKVVVKKLMTEMARLEKAKSHMATKQAPKITKKEKQLDDVNKEINRLETQIAKARMRRSDIVGELNDLRKPEQELTEAACRAARQLCYSVQYKMDALAAKK